MRRGKPACFSDYKASRVSEAGGRVLLLGYFRAGAFAEKLAGSVGRVLSDGEATDTIAKLRALRDPEGSVPYDPAVEALLFAESVPGISGGGVYDESGLQVGVVVRGADAKVDGESVVRAVRMTHIVQVVHDSALALPAAERTAVAEFLDGGPPRTP